MNVYAADTKPKRAFVTITIIIIIRSTLVQDRPRREGRTPYVKWILRNTAKYNIHSASNCRSVTNKILYLSKMYYYIIRSYIFSQSTKVSYFSNLWTAALLYSQFVITSFILKYIINCLRYIAHINKIKYKSIVQPCIE